MARMITALRETYRRARGLAVDEQLQECIEQLQHPELIAAELLASHGAVARALETERLESVAARDEASVDRSRPFYPTREIFVVRDSSSFTCLASDVTPVVLEPPEDALGPEGLDYLAITCTQSPRPVLGVVQSRARVSAYPLLLRLFACLCEVAHERQIVWLDRDCFRGMLGPAPAFDLHLVLWDEWTDEGEVPERTPISQLTRDLAESSKRSLADSPTFPPILRDIVCLNMNPMRFDGRVRFDWRV